MLSFPLLPFTLLLLPLFSFCLNCLELEAVLNECTRFLHCRYIEPTQGITEALRFAIFLKGSLEVPPGIKLSYIESQNFFLHTNSSMYLMCCSGRVRLFCDPMDCSLLGSSVHGISEARILE